MVASTSLVGCTGAARGDGVATFFTEGRELVIKPYPGGGYMGCGQLIRGGLCELRGVGWRGTKIDE